MFEKCSASGSAGSKVAVLVWRAGPDRSNVRVRAANFCLNTKQRRVTNIKSGIHCEFLGDGATQKHVVAFLQNQSRKPDWIPNSFDTCNCAGIESSTIHQNGVKLS